MSPPIPTAYAALFESALTRVRRTVAAAAERSAESLGLASIAALHSAQRETLRAAQHELTRSMGFFGQSFDSAYDDRIRREFGSHRAATDSRRTSWEDLSLVEDQELDRQVQAERFGLEIGHACEWELRELDAYMATLLGPARPEVDRNPLRPELIGHALLKAAAAVSDRADVRKAIEAELTRSLSTMLRTTYGEIVAAMRKAGVQPASLSVRMGESRHEPGSSRAGGFDPAAQPLPAAVALPSGGGGAASATPWSGGTPIGQVEAGMMTLLRQLAVAEPVAAAAFGAGGAPGALPNVIYAHREALRQASRGGIDHLVIDVIASLFDQILSDPKVPPQLARQIARLQLPVLRAALGDPSFFSSRRHPVRQFVNRIASLAQGFDDFDDAQARAFVERVRDLVQEIVEGDFDRIEVYEIRLAALEATVAELSRAAVEARNAGATALLEQREAALRLKRHYEQRLEHELQPLSGPAFVRDFVSRVWSRVILAAAERDGVTSDTVRELRRAGRELFLSVQPRATPAQRKAFLAELPKLMKSINDGLNSIGWPDDRRRAFFGQLMPAHADALKAQAGSVLDFNLLARRVEQVFERGVPTTADLGNADLAAPVEDAGAEAFSRDEATRLGLLDETQIDWNGKVDIDLGAEPEVRAVDLALPGLPVPTDAPEPASGGSLADHVQIGFSYQMHLPGGWGKVRLAHVSPGRSFFVFTQGSRHQRTISLTHRMLVRLCETGRLRAFESAQLLERATARTRRQLASHAPSQPR